MGLRYRIHSNVTQVYFPHFHNLNTAALQLNTKVTKIQVVREVQWRAPFFYFCFIFSMT